MHCRGIIDPWPCVTACLLTVWLGNGFRLGVVILAWNDFGFEGLCTFLIVPAFKRLLKTSEALTQGSAQLGKAFRSEHQQRNDQDYNQLERSDLGSHG